MIDKIQRQQLLNLLQSPSWGTVELVANQLKDKIKYEERDAESEWDYVKHNLKKDGQVEGITRLFRALYDEIGNGNT